MSDNLGLLLVVVTLTIIVGGILYFRDLILKWRGKSKEQIQANSEANYHGYRGLRLLFVGTVLICGGLGMAYEDHLGAKQIFMVLIGITFLYFGIISRKNARELRKFVNS